MHQYAIHEVHNLLSRLSSPIEHRDPVVRYLCALFSELAYYHIPAWEIDNKQRAKLIPCEAYQALVAIGTPTDLEVLLPQFELPRGFVVADRGAIAVGVPINRRLFIGFRGTQFLFDWKINLRAKLTTIGPRLRLHTGFAEEALRISAKILDAIRDRNIGDIDHVFLAGHSLGGAVAAISEDFVHIAPTSMCIFGAPRYAALSAYFSRINGLPVQVRRPGDVVPTVPPKMFGYADHPYEFRTDGAPYIDPVSYASTLGGMLRWMQFITGRFEPHSMEVYRHEVGKTAGASAASSPFAPVERLTRINTRATG